jgi:hypothetical protein
MASIICTLTGGSMKAIASPSPYLALTYNFSPGNFTLVNGLTSYGQILDSIYLISDSASYAQYYTILPYFDGNITNPVYSYNSSNTNVAYISSNSIYYKSNGAAFVAISAKDILNNSYTVNTTFFNFASTAGSSIQSFVSAAPGTLRINATSAVDTRITNVYPNSALNLFTTINSPVSTFIRNPNVWTKDIDVTCISPWNTSTGWPGGKTGAGTLITPRHYILAAHFQIAAGNKIVFVDNDNNAYYRTILAGRTAAGYQPYYTDYAVYVLDSDLPPSVKFAYFLPTNFLRYLPTNIKDIPSLCLNQQKQALIYDGFTISTNDTSFSVPTNPQRLRFFANLITGDSGSPGFLIINKQLVLLTVWSFSGVGISLSYQTASINQIIQDLDNIVGFNTGYTTSIISLSSFQSFS